MRRAKKKRMSQGRRRMTVRCTELVRPYCADAAPTSRVEAYDCLMRVANSHVGRSPNPCGEDEAEERDEAKRWTRVRFREAKLAVPRSRAVAKSRR